MRIFLQVMHATLLYFTQVPASLIVVAMISLVTSHKRHVIMIVLIVGAYMCTHPMKTYVLVIISMSKCTGWVMVQMPIIPG